MVSSKYFLCEISNMTEIGGGGLGTNRKAKMYVNTSPSLEVSKDWIEYFDDHHQSPYFYNKATGRSQWENPYEHTRALSTDIYSDNHNRRTETPDWDDSGEEINATNAEPMPAHMLMTSDVSAYVQKLASFEQQELEHHYETQTDMEYFQKRTCYYSDMDTDEEAESVKTTSTVVYIPYEEERECYPINNTRFEEEDDEEEFLTDHRLNQDYVHLARTYRQQRPYMDSMAPLVCVLCHDNAAVDVFFPCEHRCVCRPCIQRENVVEDHKLTEQQLENGDGFSNCPLCASTIKKIIPAQNGVEKEIYWRWATEISPPLPKGFLRDFKHSAGVIEAVFLGKSDDVVGRRMKGKGSCTIS
jgi:hypothetical protein